ncbi:MAG TPA: winged helix DNA-binding domain-containing protein [Pilimelia sp.]|nr:winged helix DNA-binding domain-containing protein [Pilimelia sp.]
MTRGRAEPARGRAEPVVEATVTWSQVLRWRMSRQLLDGPKARTAVTAARRLCGVHAQVAASAVTALDLRLAGGITSEQVDDALNRRRTLVRTWAARGTLHLLPAADLPTWVAAMSTRTRETKGAWLRYHGVTAAQMTDILAAIPDVLGDEPLTRQELTEAIVKATGHHDLSEALNQGFGALLKPAAFRGLLCSGPPRGRNVTFVAPRPWLGGAWPDVPTDEAIDTLILAHLGTYGPADFGEFSRWFDLNPPLARKAFARLADAQRIAYVDVDGATGAVPRAELAGLTGTAPPDPARPSVHLLPAFDPYVVGSTRQLPHLMPAAHVKAVSRPQGWISPTLVVAGRIAGTWERDGDRVTITPFGELPAPVRAGLPEGWRTG